MTLWRIKATAVLQESRAAAKLYISVRKNEVESRLTGLFSKPHSSGRTTTSINNSEKEKNDLSGMQNSGRSVRLVNADKKYHPNWGWKYPLFSLSINLQTSLNVFFVQPTVQIQKYSVHNYLKRKILTLEKLVPANSCFFAWKLTPRG